MQNSASPTTLCALVVDDEVLIRMEAASILEEAGFHVMEAGNVAEAVALLQQHHDQITLLFSDVHMPGIGDGFGLARHTAEHWPHISIVVASARAKPGPNDLPSGARFVSKPFSAEIVRHHLRHVLPDEQQPESLRE